MFSVIFRYDDFSARSDTDLETRLLELFRVFEVSCVFGVVPLVCAGDERGSEPQDCLPLPENKCEILRAAVMEGICEPALHGCRHQNIAALPGGRFSEFVSRALDEQQKDIRRGKRILKNILGDSPSLFIPPFNSYDETTVRALEKEGFVCISAGMFSEAPLDSSLMFVPHTCNLCQLKATIAKLRKSGERDAIVMPLFHSFDFVESDPKRGRFSLDDFKALLFWLKSQPDVKVDKLSAVINDGQDISARRLASMRIFLSVALHPVMPPFFSRDATTTAFLPAEIASRRKITLMLAGVSFYVTLLVLATIISRSSMTLGAINRWLAPLGALLLATFLLLRSGRFYFRGASVLTLLVGLALGAWLG